MGLPGDRHERVCSIVRPANLPSRRVAARVHRSLEDHLGAYGHRQCLYSTTREQLAEPSIADRQIRPSGPSPN